MKSCGRVTVDLSKIVENWSSLVALSATEAGAVIKDNAYGLGAVPIAHSLYAAGCKTFFFITPEEAITVIDSLPTDINVIVLGGFRLDNEDDFSDARLIPVIHSLESLDRWLNFTADKPSRNYVLKFDTGMSRLGFSFGDCARLAELSHQLNPLMLISHLACADEPDHPLNLQQLSAFRALADYLKPFFPAARLSLANTAGIFLGHSYCFDLVRPGAGLYGIGNSSQSLKNAITLELPVLQVNNFTDPIVIGYGATAARPEGARLVVVAGGYADGINRVLGSQPHIIYKNHTISAVGKMSMDSFVLDFSSVPESDLPQVGEYLSFINDTTPLDYWIERVGSLGYEVLTSLGPRLERRYSDGSGT